MKNPHIITTCLIYQKFYEKPAKKNTIEGRVDRKGEILYSFFNLRKSN